MIKVGDINSNKTVSSGKGVRSLSGGSSFSSYLTKGVEADTHAVSGTSSISTTNAIFAAQMVDGEEEREIRKKLLKRGSNLVEKLEEIRNGLLLGYIPKEKIIEISRFVKERRFDTSDERLRDILQDIELRVEVELAKLMK